MSPLPLEHCQHCPRLAQHLAEVRSAWPSYYAKPVLPFGDPAARLIIVGLAPGLHGANASGRPFTGDHAGILLYQTLYDFGFSNQPLSTHRGDGLQLLNCRITNAVKCLPPANKPTTAEIKTCNTWLTAELTGLAVGTVLLALGTVAHQAVLRARDLPPSTAKFAHAAQHALPGGLWLLDSYHCSRYNTQTKRLTAPMFQAVFAQARQLLNGL